MPSVVFAEAQWYGSLRGGIHAGGGDDAQYFDGGSRWGIKGSAEASEGLTAVYQFEHKISTKDASQGGGRLAYVGLSGGFGQVSLGQIWNAAYNSAGAITDKSYYFGNSHTKYRHGNALSYSVSVGAMSFQADLIADGGQDTGGMVDKAEFGLTVGMGDIGKVAVAHTTQRNMVDTMMSSTALWAGANEDVEVSMITVSYAQNNTAVSDAGVISTAGLNTIQRNAGGGYQLGSTACNAAQTDTTADDYCLSTTAYVSRNSTTTNNVSTPKNDGQGERVPGTVVVTDTTENTETFYASATSRTDTTVTPGARGYKASHIAMEFSLGGVTPHLGYSVKKMNDAVDDTKILHYGISGGLGDTGMSYLVAARNVDDGGSKSTPWLFNVSRSLGGGATVIFEHGNDDDGNSGKSRLGLHVNF